MNIKKHHHNVVAINHYKVVRFKRCENNECTYLSEPKEIFYEAYKILEDVVYFNQRINIYSSIPDTPLLVPKERYLEHANKFKNKYIAELVRDDNQVDKYIISLRKDREMLSRFGSSFLTKIPAALLMFQENNNTNILVLREARLFTPNSYVYQEEGAKYPKKVISSLEDLVDFYNSKQRRIRGFTSEYIILLLTEWHNLDFLIASHSYKPVWRDVSKAFLYIRSFYQLLEDVGKDIGDEIKNIFTKIVKKQINYGVILIDQKPNQFSAEGKITDPEIVVLLKDKSFAASTYYEYFDSEPFPRELVKIFRKTIASNLREKKPTIGPKILIERLKEAKSIDKIPEYLSSM